MLKVDDRVIIVGGCQSCGCSGVVIDVTRDKVKVKFEECPTKSSNKEIWFKITNVRLLTGVEKEKPRKLYRIYNKYNDDFYCRLTQEQINFLNYLYNNDAIEGFELIRDVDIDEP